MQLLNRVQWAEITRAAETQVSDTPLYGWIDYAQPGEGAIDITFPIRFLDRPVFTFGGTSATRATTIPMVNALVIGWKTADRSDGQAKFFDGATLYCRIHGDPAIRGTIDFVFWGRSVRV